MSETNTKILALRMPDALLQQLQAIADRDCIGLAPTVRRILAKAVATASPMEGGRPA